jgi:phosphoglycerate dehydrogenase-like enzyme
MNRKPVVSLVLPPTVAEMMFDPADLERLRAAAEVFGPFERTDLSGLQLGLSEAVVVIAGWGSPRFDELLLQAAPKLKLVAYSAGSVKPIVSDALYDRGIKVTTAAAANAVPVAQFAVAMMTNLRKQVPWLAMAHAKGDAAEIARRMEQSRDLTRTTVGLISASRVGREVIKLLKMYPGVQIKVFDPMLTREQAAGLGVEWTSLEDVCRCPIVSVHAPNLPETRHLLNDKTLSLLPDHAVLINTARGAIIDEAALIAEVRRRPLYVLLDVTDPEPAPMDSPLRKEVNIILTGHIAGAMGEARKEMGKLAIDETLRCLSGQPLEHEVTRAMLATQA